MTVIGKILTFIIFFLSLVFLGMAWSINALNKDPKTNQSWYHVALKFRDVDIPALQKDIQAKEIMVNDRAGEIAKLKKENLQIRDDWQKEVREARDQAAAARAEAEKAKTEFAKSQVAVVNTEAELAARREENAKNLEIMKSKDLVIAGMQADLTKTTNEKVSEQVARVTLEGRVRTLEKQNNELVKQVEDLNQRDTDLRATASAAPIRRPPPDDVRGQIKSVGADGLVSISIGSDAGLLKGHTLEVFRTEPKPQYLGVLQVIEVSPHEAVGKLLTPQFKKLVQTNDQVASKILPSRP